MWQPADTCDLPGQQRVVKPSEALPGGLAITEPRQGSPAELTSRARPAVVTVRHSPTSQHAEALDEPGNVLVTCS